MSTTQRERYDIVRRLLSLGVSYEDASQLRRISMTLRHWYERECGVGNDDASWAIERDEHTRRPYLVSYPHAGGTRRRLIADRERGALRRLDALMGQYPALLSYVQTDPRGASLYILRREDATDAPLDQIYTRGVAVY